MYKLPIVNYKFITPNTTHLVKGEEHNVYGFYQSGKFDYYIKNEKAHPVNEERAYSSFESYMSEHYTKEEEAHIKTFTNREDGKNMKAKNTIIFTGLISLPEDVSSLGGFGDDNTKQRISEFFFNQMMEHHGFNKEHWCYYAAEHTNTKHTHLHIMIYQPDTVKEKDIVDYRVKSNCMTSMWVRTNTVRYTQKMVHALNDELVQTFLETKHKMQSLFKQEIKKEVFKDEIHKLALAINELKGNKGKLQYKELVKYSKLDKNQFKALVKNKPYAVSSTNAKIILNKVDSLREFIIKNDIVLAKHQKEVNKALDTVFPINTRDKEVNYYNSLDKQRFSSELATNLNNQIFNLVKDEFRNQLRKNKDYVQSSNLIKFKNKKNCREYKHTIGQILTQTAKQINFDLNKAISKAHTQDYIKEFVNKLKAEEFIYHKLNENRISLEQAQDIRQEIEYGPTR
ncbi:MAG: hypothetical protein IJK72_01445 [Mycoplasma sp.]|nr:hypothetical protein [Mycoplasma sp.]